MIQKLYNLKKTQTEQKLIEKSSLEQEVYKIDEEVGDLNHRINTATVEKLGSISDFMILAMHKDSLRFEVKKLLSKKNQLLKKIDDILRKRESEAMIIIITINPIIIITGEEEE